VVAGVVCGSKERISSMFQKEYMNLGGIISPNDAWLMIRSLRTLEIRVNKSAEVTQKVVEALDGHAKIEKIYFPFYKNNPQLALAKKQMKSGTGLFSILVKADEKGMERFCDNLKRFRMACSWGGYESLCYPFCAMPEEGRKMSNLPVNLVRFYVGIDEADLVIKDITEALEKV
jgi:cystathionine beta-lyase/cystathionine gamma-synthase